MDEIDLRLIQLLRDNARQNAEIIAKGLHTSASTVRRRLHNLIKSGAIRIVPAIDPQKAGLPVEAIIALDVDPRKVDSVLQAIGERPEIIWAVSTTGQYDVVVVGRFANNNDLYTFIQQTVTKIDGIRDINSSICLHAYKESHVHPSP